MKQRVLPGFGLAMGYSLLYLGLIILVPLSTVVLKTATMSWGEFWATVSAPRAVASYVLSLGASLIAAAIDTLFGLLVAWVLVRYRFPGRRILDALIDLPFALPTAVAGIALTAAYASSGWIGSLLAELGIQGAYSRLGVVIALTFVSLPFAVRTVQPVLETLPPQLEEAAATLGATRWQTFALVIVPHVGPALLTGFSLSFARALGEYGSVVFISGNMPMRTEITPLLIMTKLEQFDYSGATALAVVMLVSSFAVLLFINSLQWRSARRTGAVPQARGMRTRERPVAAAEVA